MPIAALDAIWHWMPALDAKEDAEPSIGSNIDWLSIVSCLTYYTSRARKKSLLAGLLKGDDAVLPRDKLRAYVLLTDHSSFGTILFNLPSFGPSKLDCGEHGIASSSSEQRCDIV